MIPYAQRECFTPQEVELWKRATEIVAKLPHFVEDDEVRCHEVARVVGGILKLPWADGWYGMAEHSWLWTRAWEPLSPMPNVLDVYAVGRLPPVILVHSSTHLPFEYRRGDSRKDTRVGVVHTLMKIAAPERISERIRNFPEMQTRWSTGRDRC
jgi:hypothetical protein